MGMSGSGHEMDLLLMELPYASSRDNLVLLLLFIHENMRIIRTDQRVSEVGGTRLIGVVFRNTAIAGSDPASVAYECFTFTGHFEISCRAKVGKRSLTSGETINTCLYAIIIEL